MGFDIAPYGEAIAEGSKLLNGILSRVLPAEKMSEAERVKLSNDLTMALLQKDAAQVMTQLLINQEEAKHDSVFVAGWRPAVGWVCATAMGYHFVALPALTFFVTLYKWQVPPLPVFDMSTLMTVLMGMLGLGVMRSYEKVKGETTTATKVGA